MTSSLSHKKSLPTASDLDEMEIKIEGVFESQVPFGQESFHCLQSRWSNSCKTHAANFCALSQESFLSAKIDSHYSHIA